jgi:hypothetical protein
VLIVMSLTVLMRVVVAGRVPAAAMPGAVVDPLHVAPGSVVGLVGSGFPPSSTVGLSAGDQAIGSVETDADGAFVFDDTIPLDAPQLEISFGAECSALVLTG